MIIGLDVEAQGHVKVRPKKSSLGVYSAAEDKIASEAIIKANCLRFDLLPFSARGSFTQGALLKDRRALAVSLATFSLLII